MDHVKPRRPPSNAARAHVPWRGLPLTLLLLLVAMASAHSQMGGGHGRRQNNQQTTRQQSPAPTTPFLPEIWPRLEEGALICKSRDDLVRYQSQMPVSSSATASGQAPDCHTIRKQTGIQIVAHDGPSRTQIVTTDELKETWWTNSYLPSTPLPSVAKGTGARK